MEIKEYIRNHIVLSDGAMGTYFDEIAPEHFFCSEEANLYCPEIILHIHRQYIKAGAMLIRSNTFSSNRKTFGEMQKRHADLKDSDYIPWVKKGYALACQAAEEALLKGKTVFAAADMGPIFEEKEGGRQELLSEYREIADSFLQMGASVFVLESFPDQQDVLEIAAYIREKSPEVFILGQFSFIPTGYGRTGFHYKTVLKKAVDSGLLDAAGFNCGIGAAHMERFLGEYIKEFGWPEQMPLASLPNRGYPQIVRGHAVYSDSVSYFGEKVAGMTRLGAKIIGGCCGTTPEYIQEIANRLSFEKKPETVRIFPIKKKEKKKEAATHISNRFQEKLEAGEKVCAVELDPPFDVMDNKLLSGAKALKESPVDIITIADSPLARSRADSLLTAAKIKWETGMDVMPHLACRDRNRIAVRSGLLGAYINDIRNLLIVTGDPVGREERPFTKSVFDFNSIQLMRFLDSLNEEVFHGHPVYYGGALNQNGAAPEKIADRMKKKMEAGCRFFLTQPVYSEKEIDRLAYLRQKTGAKILIGIMPLVSRRNALFIQNEMPGIHVPDEVLEKYAPEATREQWEETAVGLSLEMMSLGKDVGAGYYFMTPFHRVSLIQKIIENQR